MPSTRGLGTALRVSNRALGEMTGHVFYVLALGTSPSVPLDALPCLLGNDVHHVVEVLVGAFGDILVDHRAQSLVAPRQMSHQGILGCAPGPVQFAEVSLQ